MALSTMELLTLILGAGQGASSSMAAAGASKRQTQLSRDEIAERRAGRNQGVAAAESMADPFRHQLDQGNAIAKLDRMERASFAPTKIAPQGGYAAPAMSGGLSYTKSPELISSAAALKKNVMGGNTAPTMTDPANYGKTGALDLVTLAATGGNPAAVNGAQGRPGNPGAYLEGTTRRMPGKAFTSETRGTDLSVADASQILDRVFRTELGRAPQPGEIASTLAGAGLKPGDQWVGEGAMTSIINALRQQAAPRASWA